MSIALKFAGCLLSVFLLSGNVCSGQVVAYENHNQIDYGPLPVRKVAGVARDDGGVVISRVIMGLFTEKEHALVAVTEGADNGGFSFKDVAPGRYRLLPKSDGFCTANVPIVVVKKKQSHSLIELHMKVAGIDSCSFGLISPKITLNWPIAVWVERLTGENGKITR